ncbi:MAG: nucleotidyltransferase family protein [Proteobacteria bacterium]|nr:MAG: nucleotidyltransferase family protein [Pseudomonadota bacterium]
MDAFILAAGRGERLRPLTDATPKPLLEIGGKSLIELHLEKLATAGFSRVVVNIAWLGDRIVQALGDGGRYGIEIVYSAETPGALETAGGIINALPLLRGSSFALISADVWTDFDFGALDPEPGRDALIVLVDNPPHHRHGDFRLDDGRVALRDNDQPGFTYAGIGCYSRALFEPLAPGFRPLRPVLEDAIRQGRVAGVMHRGRWMDIGSPERLAEADALAREGAT